MVTLEASSAEAKAQLSAAIKFMNSDHNNNHGIRRASVHSTDSPYSDNSPELIRKTKPASTSNSMEAKNNDKNSHGSRNRSSESFNKNGDFLEPQKSRKTRIYSTADDEEDDTDIQELTKSKPLFQDDGPSDARNNLESKQNKKYSSSSPKFTRSASSASKSKSLTVSNKKTSKDVIPPEISAEVNDSEILDVLSTIGFYKANDIEPVLKTKFSNPKIEALLNPSVSTSKKDTYAWQVWKF